MLCCLILLRFNGVGGMGDCLELGDLQGFFWEGGKGGKSDDRGQRTDDSFVMRYSLLVIRKFCPCEPCARSCELN